MKTLRNVIVGALAGFWAIPACSQQPTDFTSFTVGGTWLADNGKHIDCHGGNIIYRAPLGRYYWYGEFRGTPRGASCYSSVDLYNWKFEGVAIQKGSIEIFERPKVAYNETAKKYVMWFHYDGNNYAVSEIGVAVSDSAKGPFTIVKHMKPNGHGSRDIGMYIDEDTKKAYIGYAADNNSTVRMVELTADYLDVTANDVDTKTHCEGPGICKKGGVYYMVTSQCTGWAPNAATYYTATNIMGPYTSKGSPCVNDSARNTFNSQPCYIFKVPGYVDAFIYMGDRWNGSGASNSQYVFLPVTITSSGAMQLQWTASWKLTVFTVARIDERDPFNINKSIYARAKNSMDGNAFDLLGRQAPYRIPIVFGSKILQLKSAGRSEGLRIVR